MTRCAYSTVITGGIWSTPTVVDVVGGGTVEVGEASATEDDLPLEQAPAASAITVTTTASARRLSTMPQCSSRSVTSPFERSRKTSKRRQVVTSLESLAWTS